MTIIDYITEEVSRQGHDVTKGDGLARIAWMIDAWLYAMGWPSQQLTIHQINRVGKLVERVKNCSGFRRVDVWVGERQCPNPKTVVVSLRGLIAKPFERPLDSYRMFEEIHPFVDGNGRSGKILLNFWNGTLHDPIFPPNDFWGDTIRNP